MSRQPLVSIVLPTHNGSRYLEQALKSCVDQTYPNWELIVVDDASTDRTPRILAHFVKADSRIRSIRHEQNRKLPAALNSGFELAKGEYLTWTSDDNLYRPRAIERMVAYLERRPQISLVYTDYSVIDDAGNVTTQEKVAPPDLLTSCNPVGACFMYRREVYEELGGYATDLFLAEDYEFWVRVSCAFKMEPLHEDLYLYRRHDSSLSARHSQDVRMAHERVLLRHLGRMSWAGRKARWRGHMALLQLASPRRDRRAAIAHAYSALMCDPLATAWHLIRPFVPKSARRFCATLRGRGGSP